MEENRNLREKPCGQTHLEMYWWMSLVWKEHGFEETKLGVRVMNVSESFKQYTDYCESLFILWNFVPGDFHSLKKMEIPPSLLAQGLPQQVFTSSGSRIKTGSSKKEPFIQQLFFTKPDTFGDIRKHSLEQTKCWSSREQDLAPEAT